MAPKALTDCPENLREAIDWLIQVKHSGGIPRLSEALSKLFDNVVQDAEKSLSSLPESDEPSARDVVGKVNEFRSSFPKDSSNTNENILHNLCSSFETFLGYKPPGNYDGSGIVYGSASRLCDAILSFLYSVLSDVRYNQPYVVGRNILHNVVENNLKPNLRAGHDGFSKIVSHVAGRVSAYNTAVASYNDRVSHPIKTLQDEIDKRKAEIDNIPDEIPDDQLKDEQKVEEKVKETSLLASSTHADKIKDLNPKLRERIRVVRESVSHETQRLRTLTRREYENYKAIMKLVNKFKQAKENIIKQINSQVTALVDKLKNAVRHMLELLNDIKSKLRGCVDRLAKWIKDVKRFIDTVAQTNVDKILKEVTDGLNRKDLEEEIRELGTNLEKKVEELSTWKDAAEHVLQYATQNSDAVRTDLDPISKKAEIGKNIGNVAEANKKIMIANINLSNSVVHLELWKHAADKVLSDVINSSNEAKDKLAPDKKDGDKEKYKIGHNINGISEAKKALDEAKERLGEQVVKLNKWITEAEDTRGNAEKRAREASDLLKEYNSRHKNGEWIKTTLGKNLDAIENAKDKIGEIHDELGKVDKSLETWKQKAKAAVQAAKEKAEDVYNRLNDKDHEKEISKGITKINNAGKAVKDVDKELKTIDTDLTGWNAAARSVLQTAVQKAKEVREALDPEKKNHKIGHSIKEINDAKGEIDSANKTLSTEVSNLSTWKTEADKVVSNAKQKVTEIVNVLDGKDDKKEKKENVEKAAEALQKKAEKLVQQYNAAQSAVQKAVDEAKQQVAELDKKLQEDLKQLEQGIKQSVTKYVKQYVGKVKGEVNKIKGAPGKDWQNTDGEGLLGIQSKVQSYFNDFSGSDGGKFGIIAGGWIDDILQHNGVVKRLLGWKSKTENELEQDLTNSGLGGLIKSPINDKIVQAADAAFSDVDGNAGMKEKIQKVKNVCELFAQHLEQKLKEDFESGVIALALEAKKTMVNVEDRNQKSNLIRILADAKCTSYCGSCTSKNPDYCMKCTDAKCILTQAIATTLLVVSSVGRQVGKELNSVFLNIDEKNGISPSEGSIASILDRMTPVVNGLDGDLQKALKDETAASTGNEIKVADSVEKRVDEKVGEMFKRTQDGRTSPPNNYDLTKVAGGYSKHMTGTVSKEWDKIKVDELNADDTAKYSGKKGDEAVKQEIEDLHSEHGQKFGGFVTAVRDLVKKDNQKPVQGKKEDVYHYVEDLEEMIKNGKNGEQYTLKTLTGSEKVHRLEKIYDVIKGLPSTFTEHTGKIGAAKDEIEKQLKSLQKELQDTQGPKDGVIDQLKDLMDVGLTEQQWNKNGNKKGLQSIQKALNTQQTQLGQQPTAISGGVQDITEELTRMRGELKNGETEPAKKGVIDNLDFMIKHIGEDDKNDNGSLNKIHSDLKKHNDELPKETDKITKAVKSIRTQLALVGIRLHNVVVDGDVVDYLKDLQRQIGKSGVRAKENLHGINEEIRRLEKNEFTTHPQNIEKAVKEITQALSQLQGDLERDVTGKLTTLKDKGLKNGGVNWDGQKTNVKGFETIKDAIDTLQRDHFSKHKDIAQGIKNITAELQKLQSKLNDHVTQKLRNVQQVGLSNTENWNGKNGLDKIKNDLQALKDESVRDLNSKLNYLCNAVKGYGRDLQAQLEIISNDEININLKSIHRDLDMLLVGPVHQAIDYATNLLDDADRWREETIRDLTAYVEKELDPCIDELTRHAREHYLSTVREALRSFVGRVSGQLDKLPEEIETDKHLGFKGLMEKFHRSLKDNIVSKRDSKDLRDLSSALHAFWEPLKQYLIGEIRRHIREENEKRNPPGQDEEKYTREFFGTHIALIELLDYVTGCGAIDQKFREHLETFNNALHSLMPTIFGDDSTPLLQTVKEGLSALADRLGGAYVNSYSGATLTDSLVEPDNAGQNAGHSVKLTPYGAKCAKVFLSCLPTLFHRLYYLFFQGGMRWKSQTVRGVGGGSELRDFLSAEGYDIETLHTTLTALGVTGKLFNGFHTYGEFDRDPNDFNSVDDCAEHFRRQDGPLVRLYNYLLHYYRTCQLVVPKSPRSPCNIYEMLCWLTGLKYNCAYDKLCKFTKLCYDEQTEDSLYPATFAADALVDAVERLTADCPSILTTVLGYGNAMTTYACDFHNNSLKLHYPQDGEECLHLLLHCLRLLLSVLRYLLSQCSLPAHHGGWADCQYGKGVPPYTWQCNPPLSALPNTHTECTYKSPLMSYLNDCLPGHLPHQVSNVGCEPLCKTCPTSEPGMPCLTPLGFRGFSGSTKTGKQLCRVLTKLFSNVHLTSLLSIEPRPPATLPEHLAFATSLVREWRDGSLNSVGNPFQECFRTSITYVSMNLCKNTDGLTYAFRSAYGNSLGKHAHTSGDPQPAQLSSLSVPTPCPGDRVHCAPYLQSLCHDAYYYMAQHHSDLYLSWAIYLPWTFYELLLCLQHVFQEMSCRDWGCDTCLHPRTCDRGSHGVLNPVPPQHGCRCPSIVQCTGVMPTLYQYGFTFRDAPALISQHTTCFTFRTQLSYVINSEYFRELFDQCDDFLWKVRTPFFYTIVALWLIATLYIAHSLLYRMDVLRIRSHLLTTRASHLIDVKALLTKGRRMLSLYHGVDYFDDDLVSQLGVSQ
ncbi:Extracellular matrix-binding ebh, putative [Babesia ovata]|uniref:Extracellular matrix-binding ebh, putative n=1 Tax=Babesia ovata TaxID=189622 RepID=A0A2H6K8D8_9APIC|nr:Extracellular matrix-binding ebh, putative [Babesia ovata]GBE59238.1 Extracellular matrix-binding ebh, putative [Babesia ovata]